MLFILAFRTGMRREELLGLQFRDIEYGSELALIIRANSTGDIKTSSANRRIPVWALLKPDELLQFRDYLSNRNASLMLTNAVVFSINSKDSRLPTESLSRLFKTLMGHVLQSHSYSFHIFRHTALSNLALILHSRPVLIEHLTDYNLEDCERIRTGLLGKQHTGQDRWRALAQVAGHIGPDHTFKNYIHFAHLAGGVEINQGHLEFPLLAFENITQYSTRKILSHNRAAINHDRSQVYLNKLRSFLTQELTSKKDDWKRSSTPCYREDFGEQSLLKRMEIMTSQLPGSTGNPISMPMLYNILKKIEAGDTVDEIVHAYSLPQEIINLWLNKAEKLAQIKTQQERSRLFEKDRIETHPDILLSPYMPLNEKEQLLIIMFFEKAIKLHHENRELLHQFIDTFLNKVIASKSEIRFTQKEISVFSAFYQTGAKLIKVSSWKIFVPSGKTRQELRKHVNLSSASTVIIGDTDDYQGYSLSIKYPDTLNTHKDSTNKGKLQIEKSSFILKYACHMLAIADPTYSVDDYISRIQLESKNASTD